MDNSQYQNEDVDDYYLGVLFEAEEETAWAQGVLGEEEGGRRTSVDGGNGAAKRTAGADGSAAPPAGAVTVGAATAATTAATTTAVTTAAAAAAAATAAATTAAAGGTGVAKRTAGADGSVAPGHAWAGRTPNRMSPPTPWRCTGRGTPFGSASRPGMGPLRLAGMTKRLHSPPSRMVIERSPEHMRAPTREEKEPATVVSIDMGTDREETMETIDESCVVNIPGEEVLRKLKEAGGLPKGTFKTLGVQLEDVLEGVVIGVSKTGKWTERDVLFKMPGAKDEEGDPQYMVVVVRSDDETTIRLHKMTIRLVPREQLELLKSMSDFHKCQTAALSMLAEARERIMKEHEERNAKKPTKRRRGRLAKRKASSDTQEPLIKTPRGGAGGEQRSSTPTPLMEVPLTPIPSTSGGGGGVKRQLAGHGRTGGPARHPDQQEGSTAGG